MKISLDFLNRIIAQSIASRITTKAYIDLFHGISTELVKRNELDAKHQCREFIKGLPTKVQDQIFKESAYDPFNIATYDYQEMHQIAVSAYKYEQKRRRYNEANSLEYAQSRQERLNAIVQEMDPSIEDESRASEVSRRTPAAKSVKSAEEIDRLAQQLQKLSVSTVSQEDLQKAIDAYIAEVTDKIQAMLLAKTDRMQQDPP